MAVFVLLVLVTVRRLPRLLGITLGPLFDECIDCDSPGGDKDTWGEWDSVVLNTIS